MTSGFALSAGRKLFERNLAQYAPADPLYETYTDNKGRERRRKRELPPGLSKRDANILKSVKRRAHYLDKGFSICGMRFGWTFIIGIVPGVGDVADATLNYVLVVRKARQADLPDWLVQKMLLNNMVSIAVGFVPLLGDIVLALFKANSRNATLLEEYLRIRGEEFLKMESHRVEDPANVRPGAGRAPGEHVPGKDDKVVVEPTPKSSNSFRFWNKGKGKSGPTRESLGPHRDSRFVENMQPEAALKS